MRISQVRNFPEVTELVAWRVGIQLSELRTPGYVI